MKKDKNQKVEVINEEEVVDQENVRDDQMIDEVEDSHDASEDEQIEESNEDLDELKIKIAQEQQKTEELENRLLRVQADYDNFRRRTQKEKVDMAKYAASSLLEKLLPVVDNLERAIESSKQTENYDALVQGVEMVYRQLIDAFNQEGAEVIDAVGKPFDPHFHQAVMQVESDEYESGTVVEELQKGYILNDKVIRHSVVKVTT